MMFKRIREKLEAKEAEKQKMREELSSDYVSSETVSTENNSVLSRDEKQFLKAQKEKQTANGGDLASKLLSQDPLTDITMPALAETVQELPNLTGQTPDHEGLKRRSLSDTLPVKISTMDSGITIDGLDKIGVEVTPPVKRTSVLEMIKEKNPIFEEDKILDKKEQFNPVKILGNLLKDLTNRRKGVIEDGGSIGGGSKVGSGRRQGRSSKMKNRIDSPRKSKAGLQKIEEGEEFQDGRPVGTIQDIGKFQSNRKRSIVE
jgi:hypothetical protein